jgi:hypothetical protein
MPPTLLQVTKETLGHHYILSFVHSLTLAPHCELLSGMFVTSSLAVFLGTRGDDLMSSKKSKPNLRTIRPSKDLNDVPQQDAEKNGISASSLISRII